MKYFVLSFGVLLDIIPVLGEDIHDLDKLVVILGHRWKFLRIIDTKGLKNLENILGHLPD